MYIWKSDWHGWVVTSAPRRQLADGPNYLWAFTEDTWRGALKLAALRQKHMVKRAMGIPE
jgi:hypothetical protein